MWADGFASNRRPGVQHDQAACATLGGENDIEPLVATRTRSVPKLRLVSTSDARSITPRWRAGLVLRCEQRWACPVREGSFDQIKTPRMGLR